ncbi:MAG: hypothetical protein R3272_01265 [Candidatus Promineifilaceae bacterium]|nr:hypothetical protein [Candidatus Promineifilaceae bacterium]
MNVLRRGLPALVAIVVGIVTLFGLLTVPPVAGTILGWATFLAAVALAMGVLNLFGVHFRRTIDGSSYSFLLLLSMLGVFGLALTDALGFTTGAVELVFFYIQAPLEAALASLLVFLLLFAGFRLLQRERTVGAVLFLLAVLFFLFTQSPLPAEVAAVVAPVRATVDNLLVAAGVRGLLLGIALGVITLSLRLLAGIERPYSS